MDSLPELSNEDIDAIMNADMLISDATALYRKRISANARPYEIAAIKHFNNIIDRWSNDMLTSIGKNGRIRASLVNHTLTIFQEGHETFTLRDHEDHLVFLRNDVVQFWINELHSLGPRDLLRKYGLLGLQTAWAQVTSTIRHSLILEKRRKVYSSPESGERVVSARQWHSNANVAYTTITGKQTEYNFSVEQMKNIGEVVTVIIRNVPNVDDSHIIERLRTNGIKTNVVTSDVLSFKDIQLLYKTKCGKNTPQLDAEVIGEYNTIIDAFIDDLRRSEQWTNGVKANALRGLWALFIENRETHLLNAVIRDNKILTLSQENVAYWVNVLSKDFNDVLNLGALTVVYAWEQLISSLRLELVRLKRESIFVHDNLHALNEAAIKHVDVLNGTVNPFNVTEECIQDISEKVNTILANVPRPQT